MTYRAHFDYSTLDGQEPYQSHTHQDVEVLRRLGDSDGVDDELFMFRVRWDDGVEGNAWLDELICIHGKSEYAPDCIVGLAMAEADKRDWEALTAGHE